MEDERRPVWLFLADGLRVQAPFNQRRYLDELLCEVERERAADMGSAKSRAAFVAGRAVARVGLATVSGLSPQSWRFTFNAHGKPLIDLRATLDAERHGAEPRSPTELLALGELSFSISHTHGLVACVVGRGLDVGVDVEDVERVVDWRKVAMRHFCAAERDAIASRASEMRRRHFFALWTLKEALLKASGRGFSVPVRSCCVALDAAGRGRIIAAPIGAADKERHWVLLSKRQGSRHQLGIATAGSHPFDIELKERWLDPLSDEGAPL